MKRRAWAFAAVAMVAAACGVVAEDPQDAPVHISGKYQLARYTPGHVAHLGLKGEKQLQCTNCHALGDGGFSLPGTEVCATCHEAQSEQHHPLNEKQKMSCFTCHPFTAAVGQRFEKWRCLDCHREPMEGKPGIEVHAQQCVACHRPHLEPFTQAADCRTCHDVEVKHGFKASTMAGTCMACHPHHTKAAVASQQCLTCHATSKVPASGRVEPEALFANGHTGCGSCHTPHTFVKSAVKACTTCHTNKPVLADDVHSCVGCHQPHVKQAAPVACLSCHKKVQVTHPKTPAEGVPGAQPAEQACIGCHPPHAPEVESALARPCTACHSGGPFKQDVVHAATVTCDSCHEPHVGKPKPGLCKQCHQEQLTKTARNAGHADCVTCHAGLPHDTTAPVKPCLACHEDVKPTQVAHQTRCAECHEDHSGRVTMKSCAQCHELKSLGGLHQVAKHAEKCTSCHAPHPPEPGFGPQSCLACHKTLPKENHPTLPKQCASCHLFRKP